MAAPLRRVVKRDLVHRGASLSKRGDTITMTNYYDTSFTLECGHRIYVRGSCSPNADRKRCNKCVVIEGEA